MRILRESERLHCFGWPVARFLMCCIVLIGWLSVASAGPEDAQVVHGQVTFQQNGLNTTIFASDRSVINYASFDIARPEIVEFIQPSSSASVLNRILSASPTSIEGTLRANGSVFFINPAGVIIGGGATINVNQLVASGLNISNESFISGQYEFVGGNGAVINYGDISAQSVYLVGKQVTNAGSINCPDGYVVMAAGDRVFLAQPGSDVMVEIGSLEAPDQSDAQLQTRITNEGAVRAEAGRIVLAAAGDAFAQPIMENVGSLSTSAEQGNAGSITLQAFEGQINNAGSITAKSDSGTGGIVTIDGADVTNTGTVDVSGAQGGTVALEGTNRLSQLGVINADGVTGDGGNIDLQADEVVLLGEGSLTTANAGLNGDGGDVVAFSPDTVVFSEGARIEVKGGSQSGNGGFAEVSGDTHVQVGGSVDAQAPEGNPGTFLIDPHDVTISNGSGSGEIILVSWLENQLNANVADVLVSTSDSGSGDGRLSVDSSFGWTTDNSLTLFANTDMFINAGISNSADGNLTLEAQRDINIDAQISLTGGLLEVLASQQPHSGNNININENISAAGIRLKAGCDTATDQSYSAIYVADGKTLTGTAGNVIVEAVHDVVLGGAVSAGGDIFINADEDGWGNPKGAPADYHPWHSDGGDLYAKDDLTAGGSVDILSNAVKLDGNVSANGGDLTIAGRSDRDSSPSSEGGGLGVNWGDIEIASGKMLYAASDIDIIDISTPSGKSAMTLTGYDSLAIEAAGGEISAPDTFIRVNGSSLTLHQHDSLDLKNLNFLNQSNTDLKLVSNNGSIKAMDTSSGGKDENAADQWASVGATAQENVQLQGSSLTSYITAKALTSYNGSIEVTSDNLKVLATEDVRADNGSISLTANDGADVTTDIIAGTAITLTGLIEADGSGNQTFDAGTGTLWAKDAITKTEAGDLTLSGDTLVKLVGKVQVDAGNLVVTDTVNAEADLQATGLVHLQGLANLATNVWAMGSDITFDEAVDADGSGNQTFDAGTGTLWAKDAITKTGTGNLTLSGDTDIDLDGTVDVRVGSLSITDDFRASGDLLASGNVTFSGSSVNVILDGSGDQSIDAASGVLTANGFVNKITNGNLTLRGGSSGLAIDIAETIGVAFGNLWVVADNGDIQLSDDLTSLNGGVSIVSGAGSVYSAGGSGALNVGITGSSNDNFNGTGSIGVALCNGGKAAIVIMSRDALTLGPDAVLAAGGLYNAGNVDDRPAIYFLNSGELGGERIDIAVYLASSYDDVHIGSGQVYVAPGGTMVVDAYDNVVFGGAFVNSLANGGVGWLEACSRITTSMTNAADKGSLPYANDQKAMDELIEGPYMLRGNSFVQAQVFYGEPEEPPIPEISTTEAEASSTVALASPEMESETVEVGGGMVSENLQWLGEELGLCQGDETGEDDSRCQEVTQAYLAGAFLQATDLRPNQAATQLRQLAGLLQDTGGSQNAALGQVINEFTQPEIPPSSEQFASIGQVLALHSADGTHYAVARQWLDALTEYVSILVDNIGWTPDESVEFVMGKYGPAATEPGDVSITAFIQMYLENNAG